jgi:hypothetical protein
MEKIMTDTLLAKATALLEAREKALKEYGETFIDGSQWMSDESFAEALAPFLRCLDFVESRVCTADIITGYQDLLRRMTNAMRKARKETKSQITHGGPEHDPWAYVDGILKEALAEAKNAIPLINDGA